MKKKRIGLILASIHSGSSGQVCSALIREAAFFDTTFYIFPGGRLKAPKNSEYLRNPIYNLANEKNINGLISWASSLGGAISLPELTEFHKSLEPLPFVTISQKIDNHSCVNFNAYDGMVNLVNHFLKVHHITKIAFLRGPENHVSANDRYIAFCDTMQDSGIDIKNSPLISDPFEWRNGQDAIQQLCEERNLVPGKDFSALIAASDLMAFDAIDWLQTKGFTVPDDYLAAGFNDISKSRMLLSALTTVHMPYRSMGLNSYELILNELETPSHIKRNIILSAPLVIRESCSCSLVSTAPQKKIENQAVDMEKEQRALITKLSSLFRLDKTSENAIIEPLINSLLAKNSTLFFNLMLRVLKRFFENEMDTRLIYQALVLIKNSPCINSTFIDSIENRIFITISQVSERHLEEIKTLREERNKILDALKCVLISSHTAKELTDALQTYLPQIGIQAAGTVLYNEDNTSTFVGGFTKTKVFDTEQVFSQDEVVPSSMSSSYSGGIFLVQPLFASNKTIGHFICSVPFFDGILFEDLRSVISSAFAGIFLFNEMTLARKAAEKAEQAKTEFFATVGNELAEPIHDFSKNINTLESLLIKDKLLNGDIKIIVESLKNNIKKHIERTNLIVDLTRSQSDQIVFNSYLFHPEDLFENSSNVKSLGLLPLLFGDIERIKQALTLLSQNFNFNLNECNVEKNPKGFKIYLPLHISDRTNPIWNDPGVLLANQILLLQNCEFIEKADSCELLFYWPDFNCSNEKFKEINSMPVEPYEWDFKDKTEAEIRSVYNLKNKQDFIRRPFLCYTEDDNVKLGHTENFTVYFEQKLGITRNPVLVIGNLPDIDKNWELPVPIVRTQMGPQVKDTIITTIPAIIIMNEIDLATISFIRSVPSTALSPIIIIPETIEASPEFEKLLAIQRLIICNECAATSPEFGERIRAMLAGDTTLSSDTGAIVKKAIVYFNKNGNDYISRWKLSEYVHTSEDYLTRIFHKEIGLSPWEYLSLYRVNLACQKLRQTNESIFMIAEKSGFQDQAYFCRVFKKITGTTPGRYRKGTEKG